MSSSVHSKVGVYCIFVLACGLNGVESFDHKGHSAVKMYKVIEAFKSATARFSEAKRSVKTVFSQAAVSANLLTRAAVSLTLRNSGLNGEIAKYVLVGTIGDRSEDSFWARLG